MHSAASTYTKCACVSDVCVNDSCTVCVCGYSVKAAWMEPRRFLCQSAVHRLVASRSSICHTVLHTDGHSQEVSAGYLCTKQKMQKFSLRTRMNRFVVWHTWETQILTGSHSLTGVCELVFCSWYMFERNCFQSYDSLQREEGEYKQTFHSRQVHPVYLKMLSVLTCFMAIEMLLIRLFSSLSNINPQSFLLRTVT